MHWDATVHAHHFGKQSSGAATGVVLQAASAHLKLGIWVKSIDSVTDHGRPGRHPPVGLHRVTVLSGSNL